jgi:hypothetical protein
MKTLKILAVAAVAFFCFETADAQVVVRARIGTPPPHRRVVVVRHEPVRREVVVTHQRPYHRPYYRHGHREVVVVRHPHRY